SADHRHQVGAVRLYHCPDLQPSWPVCAGRHDRGAAANDSRDAQHRRDLFGAGHYRDRRVLLMTKAGPALQLEHASAFLREGQSVNDVSLVVQPGELVAFVGSNSSGKGLALRLAAGLEAPLEGTVRLLGVNPARVGEPAYLELRRRVGVIFDQPALISNMSVFNNVVLPLRYHTVLSESDIEGRVIAAL